MCRLAIFFAVIVLGFSPGVAFGATALLVGGEGGYAGLTDDQMSTAFGGYFQDYKRISVPFPGLGDQFRYSVQVGAENLYVALTDAMQDTDRPITIGGVSEGAPTVPEVLRRLMELDESARPLPTDLNAVIYGSPSRLFYGDLPYLPLPITPYDILVVRAEYDGIADFPDNWLNLLAVVNAIMGAEQLHVAAAWTDIRNTPTYYVTNTNELHGTTTIVLIPTAVLPLLSPLLESGFDPAFVSFMDSLLRPIIDSAYNRPDMTLGIPPAVLPAAPVPEQTMTTAAAPAENVAPAPGPPSVQRFGAENKGPVDETQQATPPPVPANS